MRNESQKSDNVIREAVFGNPPPVDDIVSCLQELLAHAKEGKIQKFVCAVQEPSGYVTTMWRFAEGRGVMEAMGMTAMLHHDLMNDGIMRQLTEVSDAVGLPIET